MNKPTATMLPRVILALLCLALASPALADALTLKDDLSRQLTLQTPARRVVVLGDFCAEVVCALQAQDLLVGRGRWVSWPPALAALPHLGLQTQPNLEVLLNWQPDLILADAHLRQALPLLEKLGLPIMVFQGRDLPSLRHAVQSMAQALDRPAQGEKLLAFIDEISFLLEQRLRGVAARPLLLAFSQHGPPYYDMLAVRPLLAQAGLVNLIPAQGSVNPEWLLFYPPDLAVLALWRPNVSGLLPDDMAANWRQMKRRPELKAIARLYLMDSRLAYNLQALVGLLYLAQWRHPQAMAGIEPYAYHQRMWREFFRQPLGQPMVYPND